MILDKEITSFLMDNAESMQKVLIQEIRDKFIEKVDNKIVWKQGFRVRMQEIEEAKQQGKDEIFTKMKKFEWNTYWCDCKNEGAIRFQQLDNFFQEFALHESKDDNNVDGEVKDGN